MSSTQPGSVNPLRPYYIPPTIGHPPASPSSAPLPAAGRDAAAGTAYASKARRVLADLDYNDYLSDSTPTAARHLKKLADELLWKYLSVLMAQPFEVAKMVLQARSQDPDQAPVTAALRHPRHNSALSPSAAKRSSLAATADDGLDSSPDSDDDSDAEETAYFTVRGPAASSMPSSRNSQLDSLRSSPPPGRPSRPSSQPAATGNHLSLRRPDSVLDVVGQLWQRDGARGVWKGANASFLYSVLQSLVENWSRSFLSAVFNVPDLGLKEDLGRLIDIALPYPWTSIFVAGAAAVISGVLLSPLDLVRTRLILTPNSSAPRRTLASLRALPSHLCPSSILLPTILTSLVHPLLTLSTPLILRTRFMVDNQLSPTAFSVAKFMASAASILVKLPLETVLRRGQMAVLSQPSFVRALGGKESAGMETIVPIGRYNGVLGTMYHIAYQEGYRAGSPPTPVDKNSKAVARASGPLGPTRRRGQGLGGLWRGWKVNCWGLIGLWTANLAGTGGEGEF